MKVISFFAAIFLLMQACTATPPAPSHFTLQNGLQVVVLPNARAPVITVGVFYAAGSADEEPHKSGVAHFLEHMMFLGTKNTAPGQFKQELAALGGTTNASTTWDTTYFVSVVPTRHLARILELEADRMANLAIHDDLFQNEMKVVLEERLWRLETPPTGQVYESVNAHYFVNHPYRVPVIGWRKEIEALTPDDLFQYYHKWYTPKNALLILSGDITPEEAKKLVHKYFSPILGGPKPKRHRLIDPPHSLGLQKLRFVHPELSPQIMMIYDLDTFDPSTSERYLLEILKLLLDKKLKEVLINRLHLVEQVGVDIPRNIDTFPFNISMDLSDAHLMKKAIITIENILKELIENGFDQEDVDKVKEATLLAIYTTQSNIEEICEQYGMALARGSSFDEIRELPTTISGFTLTQINERFKRIFNAAPHMIVETFKGERPQ